LNAEGKGAKKGRGSFEFFINRFYGEKHYTQTAGANFRRGRNAGLISMCGGERLALEDVPFGGMSTAGMGGGAVRYFCLNEGGLFFFFWGGLGVRVRGGEISRSAGEVLSVRLVAAKFATQ